MIFGAGVFFTLLDHIVPAENPQARRSGAGLFVLVICAPLLLTLLGPVKPTAAASYAPSHIQRITAMVEPDELMMSDIPWAVAWYGSRPCAWLTLGVGGGPESATSGDDAETYQEMDKLKPVRAIFLTQRTSDGRFLSQMIANQRDWSYFYLDSLPDPTNWGKPLLGEEPGPFWVHGQVPTGFPLRKVVLDPLPAELFITDRNRWQTIPPAEPKK
jgi:hypothetical protein